MAQPWPHRHRSFVSTVKPPMQRSFGVRDAVVVVMRRPLVITAVAGILVAGDAVVVGDVEEVVVVAVLVEVEVVVVVVVVGVGVGVGLVSLMRRRLTPSKVVVAPVGDPKSARRTHFWVPSGPVQW